MLANVISILLTHNYIQIQGHGALKVSIGFISVAYKQVQDGGVTCNVNSSTVAKIWGINQPVVKSKPTAWYQVTQVRSKTHYSVVKRYWLNTSVSSSVWRKVHLMGSHKQYAKPDKYPVMFLGSTRPFIRGL